MLQQKGFFYKIQNCLNLVIEQARQKGIRKESIEHVIMTGGTSMMPCVRRAIQQNFQDVKSYKPFEAVSHGGLYLSEGHIENFKDFIIHAYAIRGWNSRTKKYEAELIFGANTFYPTKEPIVRKYACAHDNQEFVDLEIGEIDHEEGQYEVLLNPDGHYNVLGKDKWELHPEERFVRMFPPKTVRLNPLGKKFEQRIMCYFRIDEKRRLRVKVVDLLNSKTLLEDEVLANLK